MSKSTSRKVRNSVWLNVSLISRAGTAPIGRLRHRISSDSEPKPPFAPQSAVRTFFSSSRGVRFQRSQRAFARRSAAWKSKVRISCQNRGVGRRRASLSGIGFRVERTKRGSNFDSSSFILSQCSNFSSCFLPLSFPEA